jgi:hypothetical protein
LPLDPMPSTHTISKSDTCTLDRTFVVCVTEFGRFLGMRRSYGVLTDELSSAEKVVRGPRSIALSGKFDFSVAIVMALEECIDTETSGLYKSDGSLDGARIVAVASLRQAHRRYEARTRGLGHLGGENLLHRLHRCRGVDREIRRE